MGRFFFIVLVLLAMIFAYDQYRIQQMRDQVAAISYKLHMKTVGKAAGGAKDLVTPLASAKNHALRAKELIRKNRKAEAQREIDIVVKNLEDANVVSKDIVGDAAHFLGNARTKAVRVFGKAWKDISEEPKDSKKQEVR